MRQTQEIKETIAADLKNQQNVSEVTLQKQFGSRRADIYAKLNDNPVAILLAYNHLSASEVTKRTLHFNSFGLAVLWIFPSKFSTEFYIKKMHRWCHAAFFGQVYCYHNGMEVTPVTFQQSSTYINKRTWYKDREKKKGGGYRKNLTRIKEAVEGEPISIALFTHQHRNAWESEKISIPECHIFTTPCFAELCHQSN